METLPPEMVDAILVVLQRMDSGALLQFCSVNRAFANMGRGEAMWRAAIQDRGWGIDWPSANNPGGLTLRAYYLMMRRMHNKFRQRLVALTRETTTIDSEAFMDCGSLALKVLPPNITTIKTDAFAWCTSLVLEALPEGLTSIGESAFYGCTSLALKALPENLTTIEQCALSGCTSLALNSHHTAAARAVSSGTLRGNCCCAPQPGGALPRYNQERPRESQRHVPQPVSSPRNLASESSTVPCTENSLSASPMACRTLAKRGNARVCYWEWLARDLVSRVIDFARQGNELWWLGLRAVDKSTHANVRDVLLKGRSKRSRGHIVKALDLSFSKFSLHPHFCRDALHYLKSISMDETWMVTATSSMSYWFNQPPLRFSRLYGSDVIFMKQAELFAWLIVEGLRANCAAGPITLGVLCSSFINDLRGTKGGSAGACKVLILCNALCKAMQRVKFEESYVREVVREMIRIVQDDAKLVDGLKADARINRISLE